MAPLRMAWWPGGRTAQKLCGISPLSARSTASSTQPAPAVAASHEPSLSTVSRVQPPAAARRGVAHQRDVLRRVRQRQLVRRGVAPLAMLHRDEQLRRIAQRARDRAQPADVLGMFPAGVVAAAVGVRDEGERMACGSRRGSALRDRRRAAPAQGTPRRAARSPTPAAVPSRRGRTPTRACGTAVRPGAPPGGGGVGRPTAAIKRATGASSSTGRRRGTLRPRRARPPAARAPADRPCAPPARPT